MARAIRRSGSSALWSIQKKTLLPANWTKAAWRILHRDALSLDANCGRLKIVPSNFGYQSPANAHYQVTELLKCSGFAFYPKPTSHCSNESSRLQGTRTRQMFLTGESITRESCPVSTQDVRRHTSTPSMVLICPGCRKPMVFKGKKHILFSNGLTDLTYRCDTCDVETKRIAKASWLRVKSRRHRHHRNRPRRRGPV